VTTQPTTWTETTVAVATIHAEGVASFLLDLGSPGLMTEEAPGTVTLTAYLSAEPTEQLAALRAFCADLDATTPTECPARINTRMLQQEDWAHSWMEHFPPLAVGERLYVLPPWVHDIPAGRIAIIIDPGLAFGTGQHATTQGCLILIERVVATRTPARALDVGTGSGILAIALAKLGVADIDAVDIDPEACRAAIVNCARNAVEDHVHIGNDGNTARGSYDLITANLLSSVLIEMAPILAARLTASGELIASGILVHEADNVAAAFARAHLAERDRLIDGEWATLLFAAAQP